jgi:hypothetical protein
MMAEATLADRAIDALAKVKAMADGLELHHPERHQVRQLQQFAERLLTEAFIAADNLAWQASDLRTLAREIEIDCKPDNAEISAP